MGKRTISFLGVAATPAVPTEPERGRLGAGLGSPIGVHTLGGQTGTVAVVIEWVVGNLGRRIGSKMKKLECHRRCFALIVGTIGMLVMAVPSEADTTPPGSYTLAEWMLMAEQLLGSGENEKALVEASRRSRQNGAEAGVEAAVDEIRERALGNLLEETRRAIVAVETREAARLALRRLERIEAVAGTPPELVFLKARVNWKLGDYRSLLVHLEAWLDAVPESHPSRQCVETERLRVEAALEQHQQFSETIGHAPSQLREEDQDWSDFHYAVALDLHHIVAEFLGGGPSACIKTNGPRELESVQGAAVGFPELAKQVLSERGLLPPYSGDDDSLERWPVLTIAAMANSPRAAKTLIEHGASLDIEDTWVVERDHRSHPLFWALLGRESLNPELAALFLKGGTEVDFQDRDFSERMVLQEALLSAVGAKHFDAVDFLLAQGVDINGKEISFSRSRPLSIAVDNMNLEMTAFLIDRGAEVDYPRAERRYFNYSSPPPDLLSTAVRAGAARLVSLLVSNGAEATVRDLYDALRLSEWSMAISLIDGGASVNGHLTGADGRVFKWSTSYKSYPLLYHLIRDNNLEGTKLILDRGAKVTGPKDPYSGKPLNSATHVAAHWGNIEATELLLKYDANIDARNRVGSTPLHEAAREWQHSFALYLVEKGASTRIRDVEGRTPADIACAKGNITLALELGSMCFSSLSLDSGIQFSADHYVCEASGFALECNFEHQD